MLDANPSVAVYSGTSSPLDSEDLPDDHDSRNIVWKVFTIRRQNLEPDKALLKLQIRGSGYVQVN